jgi:hypothetical protein
MTDQLTPEQEEELRAASAELDRDVAELDVDPAPDPPATDPAAPAAPLGKLRIPDNTNGHYVVLFARRPVRGDATRPSYTEVACVKAHSPDAAKRAVMNDDEHGPFLKRSAAQKPGILLRAVPAMHWPATVKPTTYDRPDPVLTIG